MKSVVGRMHTRHQFSFRLPCHRLWLMSVLVLPSPPAEGKVDAPQIEIRLDASKPDKIDFAMLLPRPGPLTLYLPDLAQTDNLNGPRCASGILANAELNSWLVPKNCRRVTWSSQVPEIKQTRFDASAPTSVWSADRNLWILTNSLPWLRAAGHFGGAIRIIARTAAGTVQRSTHLPGDPTAPLYIVIGKPVRRVRAGGADIDFFGNAPKGPHAEQAQHELAAIVSRWQRDLKIEDHVRAEYRYLWFSGPTGGHDTGIQASSGSDAILIQFVADPDDPHPDDKLQAGLLLTGAHEAFHSFGASFAGEKPAWFNESIATYFAYQGARAFLTGGALAIADGLIKAPAAHAILNVQEQVDQGEAAEYQTFYSRGARFWQHIDRILVIPPNRSGRLAALFQRTLGFSGVRWKDPEDIAAFFDRYSGGAAGPVVRCYLVNDTCPEADG